MLFLAPLPTLLLDGGEKSRTRGGCLACHQGIMPFAEHEMMDRIRARGKKYGDADGCIICHGGTPAAASKEAAHRDAPPALRASGGPQRFYPNPGNALVAEHACGQCHEGYAQRLLKSLIGTNTEHIHRNLCEAGLQKNYVTAGQSARWFGRYEFADADGTAPNAGSNAYKSLMAKMTAEPSLFAGRMYAIPVLPSTILRDDQQSQCHNCHDAGPSRQALEDEHGSGCSACHVPYRSNGVYLGNDPTIDKSQPGKLLMHRLQGTANTRVTLPAPSQGDGSARETYSGILLDNCFTCHHDVRKENLNPIGAVMTHYGSFHERGTGGALLCQDCHTTIEMHGDGNIPLTSDAQMEVKCEDCHGTVKLAPWELSLGDGGNPGNHVLGSARGLASKSPNVPHAANNDGYLLTSRGNPFGNVVKDGDRVLLHSATGKSYIVPILKVIGQNQAWKSDRSRQAMFAVKAHGERLSCLTCHGDGARPCFGCHVSEPQERTGNHE